MKSNRLISFFTIVMILFSSNSQAQITTSNEQITKMLIEFYSNYITENSKIPANIKNIEAIKRKYCTVNLINKIEKEELDYDPILNAQDCDIKWLNTLSVVKYAKKSNIYIVSYIDSSNKMKNTIKLIVVKEKNVFKVNFIF